MTDMKKIMFFAALMFAALSCSKESRDNSPVEPALAPNQFSAGAPASKVTINDSWALFWEAGDAVSINDGSATTEFHATTAGASTILEAEGFEADASKTYVAVYPAADGLAFDGSSVTLAVAGDRTATPGVYPAAPAVAVTGGDVRSFGFANVCGLVSFCITESNVTSVVLFGGNEENLAGTVSVNCSTGAVSSISSGEKSILLTPASGAAFTTGRYYVAVLPQNFASGMSISLYKTDGTRVRRNTGAFNLVRSTHVDLENVDENRSWKTEYSIKNADELQAFLAVADQLPATALVSLANDIDLGGVTLIPASSFAGTFDGAGHSLINWTTRRPLIKCLEAGAVLKDLEIAASCEYRLNEESYAAASGTYTQGYLVGKNKGTVSGCVNRASLSTTSTAPAVQVVRFLGLMAGENVGTISNCKNYGNVNLSVNSSVNYAHHVIGGVCGKNDLNSDVDPAFVSVISSCENHGKIAVTVGTNSGARVYVGGILGRSQIAAPGSETVRGSLSSCKNYGAVSLSAADGAAASASCVGGIAGYLEGSMTDCHNYSTETANGSGVISFVANQDASESVEQQRVLIGGVAGGLTYGASDCVNDAAVNVSGCFRNGSDLTNAVGGAVRYTCAGGVFGSVGNNAVNATVLLDNCDNNGLVTVTSLMASAQSYLVYTGGVAGYTSIPAEGCDNAAAVRLKSHSQTSYLGGVFGFSLASITNCDNSADVDFDYDLTTANGKQSQFALVAGIVGATSGNLDISQCDNTGSHVKMQKGHHDATGSYLAGIVGDTKADVANNSVNVISCTNSADILYDYEEATASARLRVGGIAGQIGGRLDSCTNSGDINISNNRDYNMVGGLAAYMNFGYNHPSTIDVVKTCTQNGNITFSSSAGRTNTYVGGFIARYDAYKSGSSSDYKDRAPHFSGNITSVISASMAKGGTGFLLGFLNKVAQANFGDATNKLYVHSGTSVNGTAITADNVQTRDLAASKRNIYSNGAEVTDQTTIDNKMYNSNCVYVEQ